MLAQLTLCTLKICEAPGYRAGPDHVDTTACYVQVDNLRTNHRGTFALKDVNFRWVTRLSADPPSVTTVAYVSATELAKDYLYLPCAMIRGALCHLGVDCTVTADCSALPTCDFTINIKPKS